MWRTRAALGGIALSAVLVGASAGAAQAVNYVPFRPQSNPLGKTEGNGTWRTTTWTWGDWEIARTSTGDKSHGSPRVRVNNANGYQGYVTMKTTTNAGVCYAPEYTSCSQKWYDHAQVDTSHSHSTAYVMRHTYTGLKASADYARGRFYARMDMPGEPDKSSDAAYAYRAKPY